MSSKAQAPQAQQRSLKVVYRNVDDLIPYVRNSKKHSEAHVAMIAASIKEFGFTAPVLIDGEQGIMGGHGRVLAARLLRMTQVPTIELTGLTELQRRAYIIADNRLGDPEFAPYDEDMLKIELEEIKLGGMDIGLVGFTQAQLDELGGDWDSDIDKVERNAENTDGILSKITVRCEPAHREALVAAVKEYASENGVKVEVE